MLDFQKFSLDTLSNIHRELVFLPNKNTETQKFNDAYTDFCTEKGFPRIDLLNIGTEEFDIFFYTVYHETDGFVRKYCKKLNIKEEKKIIVECSDISKVITNDSAFIITLEVFNNSYDPNYYNYYDIYRSDLVICVLLDSIGI